MYLCRLSFVEACQIAPFVAKIQFSQNKIFRSLTMSTSRNHQCPIRQRQVWICSPRTPGSLVEITKDWLIMANLICYWTYAPRITSRSLRFLVLWTSHSPCWKRSCPHSKPCWRKQEQHQPRVKSLPWLFCAEGATTLREPSSFSMTMGLPLRRIS